MSDLKAMYRTILGDPFPETLQLTLGEETLSLRKRLWSIDGERRGLRYGENPDQPAALYAVEDGGLNAAGVPLTTRVPGLLSAMTEAELLQSGKHPGKINLTDVDNGINILQYLHAKPAAVILKHTNPCGAAWSDEGLRTALTRAYAADRIAAFGGAVVVNRPLTEDCAQFLVASYFEIVAAPEYTPAALEVLATKKNLRVLRLPGLAHLEELLTAPFLDIKSLTDGGIIIQTSCQNRIRSTEDFLPAEATQDGVTVMARRPTPKEAEDLLFAWAVEAGVTSNSVIFARDGATVAIGTGEQDRVGCVDLTIYKAFTKYADGLAREETGRSIYDLRRAAKTDAGLARALEDIEARTRAARGGLPGSVLVSDGFFPFRDGVDLAIEHGVTAIAQPGGSLRDAEVIAAVNEATPQVAMVFTGQRSFKH